MRPLRVDIGPLPRAIANAHRILGRNRSRDPLPPEQSEPLQILGSDGKPMKRPAVQGWAALYDHAFAHGGRVVFLKMGAFVGTLRDSSAKRLLFDHDESRQVGSTSAGLEFANAVEGLAFRMPLSGNPSARLIADTVGNGERACVSVGISFTDCETREIHGHQVDIVSSAKLLECSLVKDGAIASTYARIVDLDDEDPSLWSACRKTGFSMDQRVANVQASGRRIIDNLRKAVG